MRILEVTDCYPPPLVGGRDLAVQMLSHELAARGHEVEVVTLAGPDGPRIEDDAGIPVHRVSGWSRVLQAVYADPRKPWHPTLPDPGLVDAVRRLLRDFRPDVVHAHSWFLYSLLPLLPSKRTKLVVWLHDQSFICSKTTYVYRGAECSGPAYLKCVGCASEQYGGVRSLALTTGISIMKPWRRRVSRYVANSQATARASARLVAPSAAIEVIPPFVPDEAFDDSGPRPSFVPADGDYAMFAGSLAPHKGLDVLLEAWTGLQPTMPLVLAGIRHPNTPKTIPKGVVVAENVAHADVLRAWRHSLFAVVPSVWPEPFGLVALEAMAAGRPVIASDVGGLSELVVHGETGLLVPGGDAGMLRDSMKRLAESTDLRDRMGVAGRERAAAFRASVVVGAWERVFDEVIADGATPARGVA